STELRRASLKSLQKDVIELLRDIAHLAVSATRGLPKTDSNKEQTLGRGIALDVGRIESLSFLLTQPPTTLSELVDPIKLPLVVRANLKNSFLFALGLVLLAVEPSTVRQCPGCSTLFVAEHGRQQFCTPKCANRAGFKRYRETHKEEER